MPQDYYFDMAKKYGPYKVKKRRYHGKKKQSTPDLPHQSNTNIASTSSATTPTGIEQYSTRPTTSVGPTGSSSSKRKLGQSEHAAAAKRLCLEQKSDLDFNILLNVQLLKEALEGFCFCAYGGKLELYASSNLMGLAMKMYMQCQSCNLRKEFNTSKNMGKNCFEVNRRFTMAFRCNGKGRKGGELFCGIMNMPPPSHGISIRATSSQLLRKLQIRAWSRLLKK